MAPGWCNMFKRYWTVPLLILTCLTGPTSTQNYWEGLPTFCSPIEETTVIQQLPEFEYRGCYADQSNPRLLPIGANSTGSMTVTTCASICSSQGTPSSASSTAISVGVAILLILELSPRINRIAIMLAAPTIQAWRAEAMGLLVSTRRDLHRRRL